MQRWECAHRRENSHLMCLRDSRDYAFAERQACSSASRAPAIAASAWFGRWPRASGLRRMAEHHVSTFENRALNDVPVGSCSGSKDDASQEIVSPGESDGDTLAPARVSRGHSYHLSLMVLHTTREFRPQPFGGDDCETLCSCMEQQVSALAASWPPPRMTGDRPSRTPVMVRWRATGPTSRRYSEHRRCATRHASRACARRDE